MESLIEPVKSPEDLLKELKSINQCHYQDVCEERGILKICGYPLCNENLKEYVYLYITCNLILLLCIFSIPTQQYKISVTNKKVYDITERKLFCSAKCFKASNFIKDQLLTSPLWCRDLDEIPEFKLLSLE